MASKFQKSSLQYLKYLKFKSVEVSPVIFTYFHRFLTPSASRKRVAWFVASEITRYLPEILEKLLGGKSGTGKNPVKVWDLDDVWVDGDDVDAWVNGYNAGDDVHADDVVEDDAVVDDHDETARQLAQPVVASRYCNTVYIYISFGHDLWMSPQWKYQRPTVMFLATADTPTCLIHQYGVGIESCGIIRRLKLSLTDTN